MALQLFSFCPGGEQAMLNHKALPPIELQQEPLPEKPAERRAKKDEEWVEEGRENLGSES